MKILYYVFYLIVLIQAVYIVNLFGVEANAAEDHSSLWESSSSSSSSLGDDVEASNTDLNTKIEFSGINKENDNLSIQLTPETLVYSNSPVCIPSLSQFVILNTGNNDLELLSIKSDSDQFYPVVFERQVLKSRESMTIQLLFLPYYMESVTATLTIVSSKGDIVYHVRGEAIQNEYGVRPFTGLRIPRGMPYEQPIIISNPHNEALRVREVFTTEDFLSLSDTTESNAGTEGINVNTDGTISNSRNLQDGSSNSNSGATGSWEIAPGESKEILHLSIASQISGRHLGYLHIKTDQDNMVVPVDATVLEGVLFATPQTIDFGILTGDSSHNVNSESPTDLWVFNSGLSPVQVVDIVQTDIDNALKIDAIGGSGSKIGGRGITIPPESEVKVAKLSYNGVSVRPGKTSNSLLVMTNASNPALATLEVPYTVTVLEGGIGFEQIETMFLLPILNGTGSFSQVSPLLEYSSSIEAVRKNITLTNYFNLAIKVTSIVPSTGCENLFSVAMPGRLESGDALLSFPSFEVQLDTGVAMHRLARKKRLPFTCWLDVLTNVSSHRIPLTVTDGRLMMTYFKHFNPSTPANDDPIDAQDMMKRMQDELASKEQSLPASNTSGIHYLDFGDCSVSSPKPFRFLISNLNPLPIPLEIQHDFTDSCLCYESVWSYDEALDRLKDKQREFRPLMNTELGNAHRIATGRLMQSQFDYTCTCDGDGSNNGVSHNGGLDDFQYEDQNRQMPKNRTTSFPTRSPFTTRINDDGTKTVTLELPKHSAHTVQVRFQPRSGTHKGLTTTDYHEGSHEFPFMEGKEWRTVHVKSPHESMELRVRMGFVEGEMVSTTDSSRIDTVQGEHFMFGFNGIASVEVGSTFETNPTFTSLFVDSSLMQIVTSLPTKMREDFAKAAEEAVFTKMSKSGTKEKKKFTPHHHRPRRRDIPDPRQSKAVRKPPPQQFGHLPMTQSLPLWMMTETGLLGHQEEPMIVDQTDYDGSVYTVNQLYRAFLRPNNLCTETFFTISGPNPQQTMEQHPQMNNLWVCMRNFLGMAQQKHPGVYDPQHDGDLDHLMKGIQNVEGYTNAGLLTLAVEARNDVIEKWRSRFPYGIALPKLHLGLDTSSSRNKVPMYPVVLHSPVESMPLAYDFQLPVLREDRISVFMFKIYNPYELDVAFKLTDSNNQAQKHSEQVWRTITSILGTKSADTWFRSDSSASNENSNDHKTRRKKGNGKVFIPAKIISGYMQEKDDDKIDILPALKDLQIVEGVKVRSLNWDQRFLSIPPTESGLVILQGFQSEFVAKPRSHIWIGPVAFIPKSALNGNMESNNIDVENVGSVSSVGEHKKTDDFRDDADDHNAAADAENLLVNSTLYLVNNFTGVDVITLHGLGAMPELSCTSVNWWNGTDNQIFDVRRTHSQINESVSSGGTDLQSKSHFLLVNPEGTVTFHISNLGQVDAEINDIIYDGRSCTSSWRKPDIKQCGDLPRKIGVGDTWILELHNSETCGVSKATKHLQFLSENPNIFSVDLTLTFELSKENIWNCLYSPSSLSHPMWIEHLVRILLYFTLLLCVKLVFEVGMDIWRQSSSRQARKATPTDSQCDINVAGMSTTSPDGMKLLRKTLLATTLESDKDNELSSLTSARMAAGALGLDTSSSNPHAVILNSILSDIPVNVDIDSLITKAIATIKASSSSTENKEKDSNEKLKQRRDSEKEKERVKETKKAVEKEKEIEEEGESEVDTKVNTSTTPSRTNSKCDTTSFSTNNISTRKGMHVHTILSRSNKDKNDNASIANVNTIAKDNAIKTTKKSGQVPQLALKSNNTNVGESELSERATGKKKRSPKNIDREKSPRSNASASLDKSPRSNTSHTDKEKSPRSNISNTDKEKSPRGKKGDSVVSGDKKEKKQSFNVDENSKFPPGNRISSQQQQQKDSKSFKSRTTSEDVRESEITNTARELAGLTMNNARMSTPFIPTSVADQLVLGSAPAQSVLTHAFGDLDVISSASSPFIGRQVEVEQLGGILGTSSSSSNSDFRTEDTSSTSSGLQSLLGELRGNRISGINTQGDGGMMASSGIGVDMRRNTVANNSNSLFSTPVFAPGVMGVPAMESSNQSISNSSRNDTSSWTEALAISSALGSARPPVKADPSPNRNFTNSIGGLHTSIHNSRNSHSSHSGLNLPPHPPTNNADMNPNTSIGSLANRLELESRSLREAAGIGLMNVNSVPQTHPSQPPGLGLSPNGPAPGLQPSPSSLPSMRGNVFPSQNSGLGQRTAHSLPHVGSFNFSGVSNMNSNITSNRESNSNGVEEMSTSTSGTITSGRSAELLYRGAVSYDTSDNYGSGANKEEWSIEDFLKRRTTS